MRTTGAMVCFGVLLIGAMALLASAQGVGPADTGQTAAPPTQGPVPNNPDAAQSPPPSDPVAGNQPQAVGVPSEPMSSMACAIWSIVVVGVIALLIFIFGPLRRREPNGAPYADVTHNPGASGPYLPGTGAQPGLTGFTGFLGGLPGVFLINRYFRRRPKEGDDRPS